MSEYLSIPKWDEFQHYKDRNPPWIKLHNQLLENYEFECLPDASKAHLLCIWMFASRTNNKLRNDSKWIGRKIGANSKVDIDLLIESGFLQLNQRLQTMEQDASTMLQGAEQCAIPEERREEGEREREHIPYQKIKDSYNEILFDRPKIEIFSETRKRRLKSLWDSNKDFQTLKFWTELFEYIRGSDFLMGKTNNYPGCNFDFIMQQSSFIKIYEGFYHQTAQGQQ